ncbi:MAG TPA: 3-oxoacyl-ACP reductase FabG [Alphaproteobacteria bacterium]|nr:3-oxoacyl-ACP reductase FabG [Alphaproteobacteria bacterium]
MFQLAGKTALITGGSRGIGKATAKALKTLGANVIIHGSNTHTLDETAKELGGAGTIAADLMDPAAAEKIAAQAGRIDILINNAGITRDALFVRQSQQQWDEVMQVNVDSVVRLTRALLPAMSKNDWGRIVNVTSIVAHMGNVGQTNYITAKAAITGFTKALAKEVARKNITVNAVAPGFIETDMTQGIPENIRENLMAQVPARRFGQPDEIAAAIAFLCTPEAGYITGNTLHVNGGMHV